MNVRGDIRVFRSLWNNAAMKDQEVSGFTLLETVIVAGLCSVLALGLGQGLMNYQKQELNANAMQSWGELANEIVGYGGSPGALTASALMSDPANAALKSCMGLGGTCTSGTAQSMALYLPGAKTAKDALSGPNPAFSPGAVPRRFSSQGVPCAPNAPASKQCPIEVTTYFIAQCKPDMVTMVFPPLSCTSQAELLEVFYLIQQNPNVQTGLPTQMPPYSGVIFVNLSLS